MTLQILSFDYNEWVRLNLELMNLTELEKLRHSFRNPKTID